MKNFIPNSITRKVGRQILTVRKHSPSVLFGVGVVSMVGTVVTASRATLELDNTLSEIEAKKDLAKDLLDKGLDSYDLEKYKHDMVVLHSRGAMAVAKLYAPAIGLGLLSIAAFTSSHVILTKRNAALAAAYATLDKAFGEYRQRVSKEFGEEKEREIRYDLKDEKVKDAETGKVKTVKQAGPGGTSMYARFFDEYCKNWSKEPEYNLIFLKAQQAYANDLLISRGHVFLNEIYDSLGIDRSKAGAVVGWVVSDDGDNFIDFGIFDSNREGARDFVNGREGSILLDFNVDGVIYDKI